jgi:putative ABC transport system ATP-binding protein
MYDYISWDKNYNFCYLILQVFIPLFTENNSHLIRVRDVYKVYQRGQEKVEALHDIQLEVERGAFVVIMGPSGGGKSTLLHLLGGIDQPTSGTISIEGFSLEKASEHELTLFRRDHVGFIFQFYNLLPSINALDNTALPLLAKGVSRKEATRQARFLLEQVGLPDRLYHKPGQLSGGEQQRVAIARAIAGSPGLVLADEPTGDLDSSTTDDVIQLMVKLNRGLGTTFVVATHNDRISQFGDRLLELRSGVLTEC